MPRPTRPARAPLASHQGAVLPAAAVLGAVGIAALSLLLGQSLRVDPLGWLRWGREVVLGEGDFSTVDYPSWKPLGLLLTAPLVSAGPLAPVLLLVALRAAGILALFAVFELARRRAGPLAGAVAIGALAMVPGWWPVLAGGGIEPALVLAACVAVDRHERGRHGQALALLGLVALGREEAVPLVVLYGACRLRREPYLLGAALLAGVAITAAWLAGDWLGSGDPLHGGALALAAPDAVAGRTGRAAGLAGLETLAGLLAAPLWIAAALGVAAAVRIRDRTLAALVGAAVVWAGVDLALAVRGYPLQPRMLFPPAAAFCVAAGLGGALLAGRAVPGTTRPGRSPLGPTRSAPSGHG